jgi:hypothetical protein
MSDVSDDLVDRFDAAMKRVRHDIPIDLSSGLTWLTETKGPSLVGLLYFSTPVAGYEYSIYLGTKDDEEDLAAEAASLIQDAVIETLHAGWPMCPVHPWHPMWPDVVHSVGAWVCPDDATLVRIGLL